jgi:hypothetical protein
MDTRKIKDPQQIKHHMPETYKAIQVKAGEVGNVAYKCVRQGLGSPYKKGEPNKFYAVEGGFVAGTPFNLPGVQEEVARLIVQYGCDFLIMWAPELQQRQPKA